MDRFIEILYEYKQTLNVYLKSNMDRFIADVFNAQTGRLTFKIQYG